jgi:hypothetical protein
MPEKLRTCVECGAPLDQPATGRPRVYCGLRGPAPRAPATGSRGAGLLLGPFLTLSCLGFLTFLRPFSPIVPSFSFRQDCNTSRERGPRSPVREGWFRRSFDGATILAAGVKVGKES